MPNLSGSGEQLLAPQSGAQPMVVNSWAPPPRRRPLTTAQATSMPMDGEARGGVCVAVCTVLLSIPALIGSWCWPLVLAGLFAGLSKSLDTPGAKQFTHSITWGINLAIFTNMLQFVGRRAKLREEYGFARKWGPFFCILFGMLWMMSDLTRHVLNDSFGIMPMFNDDDQYTVWAYLFTFFGTWFGAFLLISGILWDTHLLQKVAQAWRSARGR